MKKLFILSIFLFLLLCFRAHSHWHKEVVDEDEFNDIGKYACLAIDSEDMAHIVYLYNNSIRYRRQFKEEGGSYLWEVLTGGPTDVESHISMALDEGRPHVSYRGTDFNIYYSFYNGSNWSSPVSVATTDGEDISIALDSDDNVYISYRDNSTQEVRYVNNYDNPSTWAPFESVIEITPTKSWGSSIAIDKNSNKIYVSYYGEKTIEPKEPWIRCKVINRGEAAWSDVDTTNSTHPDNSTDSKGHATSIALDSYSNPHIVYSKNEDELWCAHYNGSSQEWEREKVDYEGSPEHFSIAVEPIQEGKPNIHIAYYDENMGQLKYAFCDMNGWHPEEVDYIPGNIIGKFPSIKLDSENRPHIAYYDESCRCLKYACIGKGPELAEDKDVIIGNNKFDPETGSCRIMYNLSRDQEITIKIYDLTGNLVKTLFEMQHRQQGFHGEDEWDGTSIEYHDVSSGIYYIVVEGDGWKKVSKVAIVKGKK